MIIKVVYFDEDSATDYIHISAGGKNEERSEAIRRSTYNVAAKANAGIKAKFSWLPFIGFSSGGEVSADTARIGDTIIKKAVSNTILTDYLIKSVEETKNQHIHVFRNCTLRPYPDSFSFYKMVTPFLIMAKGQIDTGDDLSLDVSKMDEALESGRGYYELITEEHEQKKILRFNIKAFRNNYGIADLVKMKLTYHAIEVGTFPEHKLAMKEEFSDKPITTLTGLDIVDDKPAHGSDLLEVYDVILAGVDK